MCRIEAEGKHFFILRVNILTPCQQHQVSSADRNLQRSRYLQSVAIERACKTPLCSISQVLTMATVFGKQIGLGCYPIGLALWSFFSHLWTSWPGTFYRAKLLRTGEMSSTATSFRLEGLTEAFHKFSRHSKIGVFRPHSPASYLPYSPLCPQ